MVKVGDNIDRLLLAQTSTNPPAWVTINDMFRENIIVLKIFRRFGCVLTRHDAMELNKMKKKLDSLNVKLVGVGFDTAGAKAFQDGKFWDGDLFLDPEKDIYKYFKLKRKGYFNSVKTLIKKESRTTIKNLATEIECNYKGDGLQLGGTYIIGRNGEILYRFNQMDYFESPSYSEIVKICGFKNPIFKFELPSFPCSVRNTVFNKATEPEVVNGSDTESDNESILDRLDNELEDMLSYPSVTEASLKSPQTPGQEFSPMNIKSKAQLFAEDHVLKRKNAF